MAESPEFVAERELVLAPLSGEPRRLILRVGRPSRTNAGSWACPVIAEGLFSNLQPIHGEDSWQALMLAQQFLLRLLKTEFDKGSRLFWPDMPEPISLDQLFCVTLP